VKGDAKSKPTVVRGQFFFVLYSRDEVYDLLTRTLTHIRIWKLPGEEKALAALLATANTNTTAAAAAATTDDDNNVDKNVDNNADDTTTTTTTTTTSSSSSVVVMPGEVWKADGMSLVSDPLYRKENEYRLLAWQHYFTKHGCGTSIVRLFFVVILFAN
jgi:ATP/maltotriose-dependent transcriptional regulator MalT